MRAMPRVLTPGENLNVVMGPGQWMSFALFAGEYDLLEVAIDRPEYDS